MKNSLQYREFGVHIHKYIYEFETIKCGRREAMHAAHAQTNHVYCKK